MDGLTDLLDRLGSDKGTALQGHGYAKDYESLIPRGILNIVEIGIGTNFDFNGRCGSIRAWLEWFPLATVWGFDCMPAPQDLLKHPRFRFMLGNQGLQADLDRLRDSLPLVDAIIDDGSHLNEHQIATFNTLFCRVRPGGIYAIEEWSLNWGKPPTPKAALSKHPCFLKFFGRKREGMLFRQSAAKM